MASPLPTSSWLNFTFGYFSQEVTAADRGQSLSVLQIQA